MGRDESGALGTNRAQAGTNQRREVQLPRPRHALRAAFRDSLGFIGQQRRPLTVARGHPPRLRSAVVPGRVGTDGEFAALAGVQQTFRLLAHSLERLDSALLIP